MQGQHAHDGELSKRPPARRSLWTAGALLAGAAASWHWQFISPLWWLAATFGLLIAAALAGRATRSPAQPSRLALGALWAAAMTAGAASTTLRVMEIPPDDVRVTLANTPKDAVVHLIGTVTAFTPARSPFAPEAVANPWRSRAAGGFTPKSQSRATLAIAAINPSGQAVPAGGVVSLRLPADVVLTIGQRISIMGNYEHALIPVGPGTIDPRIAWWDAARTAGTLRVPDAGLITSAPTATWLESLNSAAIRVRSTMRAFASSLLPTEADTDGDTSDLEPATAAKPSHTPDPDAAARRALSAALLLGETSPDLRPISDAFSRLGLLHALSISGFHISSLVLLVAIALRFVGELGRWHTPLLLAVVMFYVSLIPADAPVVRSALMLLALAGTGATARRYDALGLLGWIACMILIANPRDAFSPGFQLSFLATAALISLAMPLLTRFCPPSDFDLKGLTDPKPRWLRVRLWLRRFAVGALVTCVLAWGISTPLVAHHSGWLSTVGVPASLLVLLPINLLLWAGFIALFAGGIGAAIGWDQPAAIAWLVTDRIGAVCLWLTRVLDSVPFNATTTPALGMAWSLCATAVLWWIAQRLAQRRAFGYSIPLVCIGLALWAAVILAVPPVAGTSARITTIAIGPARAVLVQRGSDNLLVDPGVVGFAQASSAARSVYSACRELGAWHCPTVLVTKPTSDAMAAILPLIKPLGIELVLLSASVHAFAASAPASPAAQTLRAIKSTGVRIAVLEEHSTIELGASGEGATAVSTFVRLVAPPAGSKPGTQPEPALFTSGSAAPIARLRNLSGTRATSASTTIELAESGLP